MLVTTDAESAFGRGIKALRQTRGWSQAKLADLMEAHTGWPVSQSMVAKTETGTRPIRLNEALAFAEVLDETVDVMLRLDDESELLRQAGAWEHLLLETDAEIAAAQARRAAAAEKLAEIRGQIRGAGQSGVDQEA